jgi:hypothetical protein
MNLTKKTKLTLLFAVALLALACSFIAQGVDSIHQLEMRSAASDSRKACIYDPVHKLIEPVAFSMRDSSLVTRVLTALDAFIIDISICSLGLFYVITGRTSTFLPTIVAFYLVRMIGLNIVTFPIPDFYFFEYPGFPSYFVDYDRVNDLYFSGHSGCLMIYIMDCLQNKRKKLLYIFVPFFLYTVAILLVEGIHYTNDIIIGVLCAITINRLNFKYRLKINIVLFQAIGIVCTPWGRIYEELQNKIAVFQLKSRKEKEEVNLGGKELETFEHSVKEN